MLEIFETGDSDFTDAMGRLSRRQERLEEITSAEARSRTEDVFGKELSPAEVVETITQDVQKQGDKALFNYTLKLDGCYVSPENALVEAEEFEQAYKEVSKSLLEAMRVSIKNVREYQETIKLEMEHNLETEARKIQTLYHPLKSVGVYAPGGLGAYPSTIVMAVVPARVAGVEHVMIATPPDVNGDIPPATLVAAAECGADEVYRVGGVQSIAAMAYGTETVPRVDKIVGPGNLFVTLAKKEVFGLVDIDMFAGPSEILIIADSSANEAYIAADMLSQAEHDAMASSILVTPSKELARAVAAEVEKQLEELPIGGTAAKALKDYGMILVAETMDECVKLANRIAPEHLEVIIAQPDEIVPELRNAGVVFVGPHTPEVVGDYIAGSSHILPTGGTARFFSGLSVNDFLRKTAVVEYTPAGLRDVLDHLVAIGRAEGFEAHARSALLRFPKPEKRGKREKK